MRRISLPHSDLTPSSLCLGTSLFGNGIDQATSFQLLDAYVAEGGNFLDTAKVYADWLPGEKSSSEKTIGRWLRQRGNRADVIVATKGAHPELATMHIPRLSPAEIAFDLHQSLRNLGVDTIDLYWLHRDDPARPVEEIMDTMQEQVQAGKIRYYGCSNWHTARLEAAQIYAARRGWTGFVANQMMWSCALVTPQALPDPTMAAMDAAMWRYHQQSELAAVPYSSQANGYFQRLADGTVDQMSAHARRLYEMPANVRRFARIQRLAAEHEVPVTAIVLAYLHSQPFPVFPVVGCRTLEQLYDSCHAADVRLSPEELAQVEAA